MTSKEALEEMESRLKGRLQIETYRLDGIKSNRLRNEINERINLLRYLLLDLQELKAEVNDERD